MRGLVGPTGGLEQASEISRYGGAAGRLRALNLREESGSALALLPAFALVVILALGFVVDGASAFLAQRELVSKVSGIASDAAELAFEVDHFHQTGEVRIDGIRAEAEVRRKTSQLSLRNVDNLEIRDVRIEGESVLVTVEGDVDLIFAPAMPFLAESAHLTVDVRSSVETAELQ